VIRAGGFPREIVGAPVLAAIEAHHDSASRKLADSRLGDAEQRRKIAGETMPSMVPKDSTERG
jgi:hypothetical protein